MSLLSTAEDTIGNLNFDLKIPLNPQAVCCSDLRGL